MSGEEAAVTEEVTVEETETAEVVTEKEEEISPLELTDEAFLELMGNEFTDENEEVTSEKTEEEPVIEKSDDDTAVAASEEKTEEDVTDTDDIEKELTEDTVAAAPEETETKEEGKEEEVSEETVKTEVEQILDNDLKLKQLFEPFKANGKDMTVDNVEDARTLMQMGANYNKKMAALKPNLKLLKMLENNDLLDETKLSYLIDLDKKNPGAIAKLIKDSNIDTDDLDTDDKTSYKPNTYTVNDTEVELDETLNDIRDTTSYAETLNIISNKWDESSKAALLKNPAGIKVLNEHIQMGIYEKIAAAVESERMFGRIPQGMSDLEAYKFVGEAINARGGLAPVASSKVTAMPNISKTTTKVVDPKLNDKKKAASSTRGSSSSKAKVTFNPLAMSDAEFEKTGLEKFI